MSTELRSRCRAGIPPRLVAITDVGVAPPELLVVRVGAVLRQASPGTVLVQLRDVALPARERLALGRRLAEACRAHGHFLAVNDRLDLAVLLDADAVHLGESAVPTEDARRLCPRAWISRACHDVLAVAAIDADAVVLSPAFAPRKGRPPLGVEAFRHARSLLDAVPDERRPLLYALGGIDEWNAASIRVAGADGVAAIGSVLDGRDPAPLLDALGIRRG